VELTAILGWYLTPERKSSMAASSIHVGIYIDKFGLMFRERAQNI
jgi:hypothetical protein